VLSFSNPKPLVSGGFQYIFTLLPGFVNFIAGQEARPVMVEFTVYINNKYNVPMLKHNDMQTLM
jgi:hypothetical protein